MATILIVDDRPSNRQFLMTLLAYGGHRMLEAGDGARALELVRAEHPELVITDILMPNMDGYEFVQGMRSDPTLARTPVIFYTATYSTPQAEALAQSCGVREVLAKPCEPQKILDAVDRALGIDRAPGAAAAAPGARARAAAEIDSSLRLFLKDIDEVQQRFHDIAGYSATLGLQRNAIKGLSQKFAANVERMQRITTRVSALFEVGMEMISERNPQRLVELFFAATCDLIDSRYAAVGMLDEDERSIRIAYAKGFDAAILRRQEGRGAVLERLLRAERVVRVGGPRAEPSAEGLPPGHPPVRDLLGIPIVSSERIYGWLYFAERRGDAGFSDEDARVAAVMTGKLALLYENAVLYDAMQRHATQLQLEMTERKRAQQALTQSEAGLRRAQLMAKLAQVVTGADGEFESWSETLPRLIGIEAERMPRSTREWLEVVHPEDRARFRGRAIEAGVMRERRDLEYRVRGRDGGWIHLRQTMEPLHDEPDAAERLRWFSTLQDVTEQREAEGRLRESEERFRQMAENIRDVFFLVEAASNRTLYLSPAFEEIYGRSCESVYADTDAWTRAVHPDDRAAIFESYKAGMSAGRFEYEYRIVRPDGSIRWLEARGFPIRDDAGEVVRITGVAKDITERKRAADELRESERRFSDLLDKVQLASLMLDRDARITYCNDYLLRLTGWRREEVQGRNWFERFIPPESLGLRDVFRALIADQPSAWHHENEILTRDGKRRLIRWNNSVLRSAAGEVVGTASIGEDVTEQRQAEIKIRRLNRVHAVLSGINTLIVRAKEREEIYRESCRIAVEHGEFRMAWIGVIDAQSGRIRPIAADGDVRGFFDTAPIASNESQAKERGLPARAMREKTPVISNDIQKDPQTRMKQECLERGISSLAMLPLIVEGESIGVLALYAAEPQFFDDEEVKLLVQLAGDISFAIDHIQKAERIDYLAYYDSLTGLANRTLFHERLQQQLAAAAPERRQLGLVILDIQRFKAINDSLGTPAGDELLKQVAGRMLAHGVEAARMSRLEADHFAVMLTEAQTEEEVARRTEKRLQDFFALPFRLGGTELRVSARAGIALYPNDGADADTLYRNAESALQKAKDSGERYLFYTQQMSERIADKLSLENKLRQALERDEFVLYYQPKVDLEMRAIAGVEALIRWQSPERGLVAPAQFIPLLEETGLILPVGAWALQRAARDHRRWLELGLKAPRVAVNVSAIQLRQRDFVAVVKQAIGEGDGIDLEITESLIMEDIAGNIAKLEELRRMQINIAIDDFGTGYSSLGYLARLPVQALKIDRSFIVLMQEDANAMALVSTIISLAHSLRLKVIAEGVETEEQAKFLRLLRCDEMQGYLFSRPVPESALVELLRG